MAEPLLDVRDLRITFKGAQGTNEAVRGVSFSIGRDWGSLERYEPYGDVTRLAQIEHGTATRSGLWSPAPIRH